VYPICEDREGAIWIGAWPGGLSRFKDGVFTNYKKTVSTPGDGISGLVTALHQDHEGRMLIGSFNGLHTLQNGKFSKLAMGLEPGEIPAAILQDREGVYWIGTQRGVISYRNGMFSRLRTEDGLASDDVRAVLEDRGG